MGKNSPYREAENGLVLRLRLTPTSSLDKIDGVVLLPNGNWVLKAKVRAQPEKGKANKAALRLIAKSAGLAPSKICLISGTKDRNKELHIADENEQINTVKSWLSTLEVID